MLGYASRVMDYSIIDNVSLTGTPLPSMLKMISVLDSVFPVAASKHDHAIA